MKILVLGTPRQDTTSGSIARALSSSHEVVMFDYERGFSPFKNERYRWNALYHAALRATRRPPTFLADRHLLRWAAGKRFDLVFIVPINLVPVDLVRDLKALTGAYMIGWFSDAIVNMHQAEFVDAPYHRVYIKDKVVVDRFRTALASDRYDYLPQAFDPAIHRPVPARCARPDAAVDVATYGNSYAYRAALMAPLLAQKDIRTVIYGIPTGATAGGLRPFYRPSILGLQKSAAMRAAKVALNTNHFGEIGGVNNRTFELAGIGAFQLTDGPTIERYFEPDVECAIFHGPDQLVEKVRYYLDRPAERAEIARRGLARAFRDHTFHHRLNEIFDRVPELRGAARLPVPDGPPAPDDGIPGDLPPEVHHSVEW